MSWAWTAGVWLAAYGCGSIDHRVDSGSSDAGGAGDASDAYYATPCRFKASVWTLEDDELAVPLICSSGRALDFARVELIDPPAGLELDRERGELHWRPALDQAANYVIQLKLDEREHAELHVGVADRFDHPDNVPVVEPRRYTHELGLPVFHLGTAEDINDNAYTPLSLIYAGDEYVGAQAKYRGARSREYAKRSFTLKLDKQARFSDASRGFHAVRRLVLTSTFDDNSQIRQRLAFELWNRLSAEHIPIRHFNAVVYLNGHYHGVYAVTDHLNDDLLESLGYSSTVNMYKARNHSANFRLTDSVDAPKKRLNAGYTKEEGVPASGQPGAFDDLEHLVSWIATTPDADFRAHFSDYLAVDFEHWFVLVTLTAAVDTTTKNYFLVHDAAPEAKDPRWRFVPWDFNASFGQNHRSERRAPSGYNIPHFVALNRLFERTMGDDELRARLMQRYRSALDGAAAHDQISSALEHFAAEVAAAASRDDLRWGTERRAYFAQRTDFLPHHEEIEYLRGWIPARWSTIAAQLDP